MPYQIEPVQRLVVWTHTGAELRGEWTRTLQTILADPAFESGFSILEYPAFYGMLRMAELLLDGTSVTLRPFTDINSAREWVAHPTVD